MAYASNSFGGGCPPTYLVSAISSSDMTATFSDLTGWVEVDSTGAKTSQPLGTSGSFCIKLDYGLATEETVKCTSLNPSTGVITFATRGFDGTTAQAHSAGSASKLNAFPTDTATDWVNLQATATTGVTNASSALSAANSKVASVTAADGTITVAGTGTAPTVKVGTVPYSQLSGTPSSLPPSGSAGGDLTGTYPNPTLAVNRLPLTGGTLTGALNGTTATFSGEATATDFKATGLTGATAASRYVGGTTSGAPASGTFLVGDFVVDQTATIWVCTVPGTPGTWSPTESQNVRSTGSSTTAALGEIIIVTGGSTGVLITLPTSPTGGSNFGVVNNNNNAISIKGGSYPLLIAGTNYGAGTSYTVSPNGVYLFVFDNVANRWVCTSTNDIGDMVNYGDVTLDKFGAPAANLPMNAKKITGLANGTASTDAAAFGQIPTALPPNGSAGGDLTGTYPNPTLAVNRLALTGGTMSGAIAMGSNRITGLANGGASTDAARVDALPGVPNLNIHTNTYAMKAWNADPAQVSMTAATVSMSTGVTFFAALTIPFATTINQIWHYQQTGAVFQATAGYYAFGIYDTSGNLLASTGNLQSSGLCGLTGHLGWPLSAPYAIAAGNYMIGFLYYTGTGVGSPTIPIFGKASGAVAVSINLNCPTPSAGKLDQRACSAGSGRTSLYNPFTATPNAVNTNFWTAVA